MNAITSFLADALPGAASSAVLVWLLRGWITERLRQSISHEYSEKLENHKNELNAKLEAVKYEYGVNQLRTSLFFDHQRVAFGEILAKVAETNREWWHTGYEEDVGLNSPVPGVRYRELKDLFFKHQLFLDSESIMAIELLFQVYEDSWPFDDGSGNGPIARDVREPYDNAEYLQPRLAALFQQKIGIANEERAVRQIALLGAIRILNRYHFTNIGLPVTGPLKLASSDGAADAVMKAERNSEELLKVMKRFQSYLQNDTAFFHEAEASLGRYISVLDNDATPTPGA